MTFLISWVYHASLYFQFFHPNCLLDVWEQNMIEKCYQSLNCSHFKLLFMHSCFRIAKCICVEQRKTFLSKGHVASTISTQQTTLTSLVLNFSRLQAKLEKMLVGSFHFLQVYKIFEESFPRSLGQTHFLITMGIPSRKFESWNYFLPKSWFKFFWLSWMVL